MQSPASFDETAIFRIERPGSKLMVYYAIASLLAGPFYPLVILPRYFKYHTLRYRFDQEGISMRWGILFRREIIVNYARIQDIHISSNVVERWLGLARVQIQTASGSADAEMTIEGLHEYEAIRDFLYSKMRGIKERGATGPGHAGEGAAAIDQQSAAELTAVLRSAAAELRAVREALENRRIS